MIIKQLINFWKGDSELKAMFSELDEMLMISKEMFRLATDDLFGPQSNSEVDTREIIKLDGKLNALQQTIRRDIVIHISVKGSKDILPCLILMSIVKDAERLGDYAKNINEIAARFLKFEKGSYYNILKEMHKDILSYFDETKDAFNKVDEKRAKKVMEKAFKSEKECDRIAWEMINAKGKRDGVALALIFRFFKRVVAHLDNICTAVTMPLDKLDYFDES